MIKVVMAEDVEVRLSSKFD